MPFDAMTQSSDSSNQADPLPYYRADDRPLDLKLTQAAYDAITPGTGAKPSRLYMLTDAALAELASERCAPPVQDDQDDEYAFTCIFCSKLIADCKCGTGQE